MRTGPRSSAAAVALASVSAAAEALFLFHLWYFRGHLIDDTFISLRYARNLAEGNGLVFNPGEYVEGYSNPSFVLIAALCYLAGFDPVPLTRLLSLVSTGAILLLVRGFETMGPRIAERPLAQSLILAGPALAYWSVASFETIPFAAIFLAALWALWNEGLTGRGHTSALFWIALAWTRPEATFLFAVSTPAFAAADITGGGTLGSVGRRHAVNTAILVAGVSPLWLGRLWYYGEILPNTYYAKVTGGSEQVLTGLESLGLWAAAYPLHAIAAGFAVALASSSVRRALRTFPYVAAIAVITLGQVAYVVAVGGDFMPYFRFFQPALALSSLLLSWGLALVARRIAPTRRTWLATGAIAITLLASHSTTQRVVAFVSHRTTTNGFRVGEALAEQLEPGDWIAVNTAGAIPYSSRLPAIDTLGLTDAAIAKRATYIVSTGWAGHRRGWGHYVLERRPKRILWYNTAGDRKPFYLGDHELAEDPYFRFFYSLRTHRLPAANRAEPLARFAGKPFGDADGPILSPELGFAAVVSDGWFPSSSVYDRPLMVHSFERDVRLDDLWPSPLPQPARLNELIDTATKHWGNKPSRVSADPALQKEVEAICEQARDAAERGEISEAKQLLSSAAQKNKRVQSPMVYQYIANVAVLSGEPFVAISAQKEALRLRPDNPTYRRNLIALLTKPYKELTEENKNLAADERG